MKKKFRSFSEARAFARSLKLQSNKKWRIYCKSGKRSAKVCEYLNNNKFSNIYNLKGGISAWSNEIDSNILII